MILNKVYSESNGRIKDDGHNNFTGIKVEAFEGERSENPNLISVETGDLIGDGKTEVTWIVSKLRGATLIREAINIYDRTVERLTDGIL